MVRVKYIGFLRTSLKVSFGGETGNDMSMGYILSVLRKFWTIMKLLISGT